jgi:hypothetical protein
LLHFNERLIGGALRQSEPKQETAVYEGLR